MKKEYFKVFIYGFLHHLFMFFTHDIISTRGVHLFTSFIAFILSLYFGKLIYNKLKLINNKYFSIFIISLDLYLITLIYFSPNYIIKFPRVLLFALMFICFFCGLSVEFP